MGIARRHFLQAGLASLIGWQFLTSDRVALAAEQYARQASVSTKRKRALLIGINQYDVKEDVSLNGWVSLHGCANDVELQQELLIHRFGFAPQDIVTLLDREATRANIYNAIAEHLTAQTLPDDLVVVHFSGHGSRLGNYNTLVPVDSGLPQNLENLRDITIPEWQGWLHTIGTDRILNAIDAGFYYPNVSTIGNFRLRSRVGLKNWQPETATEAIEKPIEMPPVGTTLRAASGDMLCADAQWSGFSSGAFTYALVQQMWQIVPATTIYVVMSDLAITLDRCALRNDSISIDKQVLEMVEIDPTKQKAIAMNTFASILSIANSPIANSPIAEFGFDGVITNTASDSRTADVCLAGLPIAVLSNYISGSILNVMSADTKAAEKAEKIETANSIAKFIQPVPQNTVQLKSRNGFNGKVEVLSDRPLYQKSIQNPNQKFDQKVQKIEKGQLLQEAIRAISRNVKLAIGLDIGLSKIERIDATSAFSTLSNMLGVNVNEQCADCLFGVQSASYGLFTVGHTPILGSFGSVGESVGVALKRLQPLLEGLLAAKLIRITENQATSHLNVRVNLKAIIGVDDRSVLIASKFAARAALIAPDNAIKSLVRNKPINIGDRLECQIENFSDRPLYVRIFCLDQRSKILTPNFTNIPYANDGIIPPSETLTIPYPKVPMNWAASAPKGMVDVQVVISHSPLIQVAKALETSQRQASTLNGLIAIPNPLQVAQALLIDLDRASQSSDFGTDFAALSNVGDAWMLDVQQWATFNFNYQVA